MSRQVDIKKLYNTGAFAHLADSRDKAIFKDSSAGVVLGRNLTAIDPKLFEEQYAGMTFLQSGIIVSNVGGYANFLESLKITAEGNFKLASDRSKGKGEISLKAGSSLIGVEGVSASANWSKTEVEQAGLQNINLVDNYIKAINEKYNQMIDESGYVGINGNKGLLNYAGFTSTNASDVATALTGEELYTEISGLIEAQRTAVDGTPAYSCNTVVMPTSVLSRCSATFLNTAGGSMSVLSALKLNYSDVLFIGTFRASDVGGVSKTVAFSTNENSMQYRLPVPLEIGEIVMKSSFEFGTDAMARIGGIDVLENESGRILSGL